MQWRQKIELTLNGISSKLPACNAFAGAELMSHIVRFHWATTTNAFIVRGRPVGGIQHQFVFQTKPAPLRGFLCLTQGAPGDKDHIMSQQVIIFDNDLTRRRTSVTGQPEREREAADCPALSAWVLMSWKWASRLSAILNPSATIARTIKNSRAAPPRVVQKDIDVAAQ